MAGTNRAIQSPEVFDLYSDDYFKWIDDDENKIDVQGHMKTRPATISGFCAFLDIGATTLGGYKAKGEYRDAYDRFYERVKAHQLEHGLLGNYNGVLVGRLLGLADKVDNNHTSSDKSMTPTFIFKPVGSDD